MKKTILIFLFFALFIFIIQIQEVKATRGLLVTQQNAIGTKPGYMIWSGTAWSSLANASAVGNTIRWLELKANPARNEIVLATLDADSDIDVQIWNGSAWSSPVEMTATASTAAYRTFDIGIMSLSGDVMVAYGNGTAGWIGYKIWDGTSWSAEQTVSTGGTGQIYWIRLEARNNSDEMMLVAMDANKRIDAIPWNGTAFGTVKNLETASEVATVQTFDVAYEASGDALIVWVDGALATPEYIQYFANGTWSAAGTAGSTGSATNYWIKMANYPGTDRIMMCVEVQSTDDLYCQEWNGASWGTVKGVDTSIETVTTYRHMDIAPVRATGGFLVGVDDSNVDYYSGYQCTSAANCAAGTWSAIITAPWGTTDIGTDGSWINMDADPDNSSRVFALMRDQTAALSVYKGITSCNATTCTAVETANAVTPTAVRTYEQFQFVFERFISDTIAPRVTLNSPANGSTQSSPVTFNCSAKDAVGLANITLYGNWSGWHANETKTLTGTSNSTTFTKTLNNGIYVWNCRACDTTNNCNYSSANYTIIIADTQAPTAFFGTNPVDNYNSSSSTVTFDMKCSDNSGISSIQLWTNTTGTWQAIYTNTSYINDTWLNITISGIAEGKYKWAVWCNDSSGNYDWTDTNRTFTIDTTGPTIALPFYTNATMKKNTDSLTLNISVSDNLTEPSSCVVNVVTSSTGNKTIPYSRGWCNGTYDLKQATDGNKTINIYANDTVGNYALNNSYVVWLDSTPPNILQTEVNSTSVSTNEIICIDAIINDLGVGLDKAWALITYPNGTVLNYSTITLMTDTGTSCGGSAGDGVYGVEINVGLTPGIFFINTTYANDTLNNLGEKFPWPNLQVEVVAANQPPTVDDISPIPDQSITESSVTNVVFYANVSDPDGYSNIDLVNATFTKAGEETRSNSSCVFVNAINATTANYSCTIGIWYWDGAGTWNVNVTAKDIDNNIGSRVETFTLLETTCFVVSPLNIAFPIVSPGSTNITSNNDPSLLNNTCNDDIELGNIQVKALDLVGESNPSYYIPAVNFAVDIETGGTCSGAACIECDGTRLQNNSFVGIANSILPAGNNSLNYGNETSGQEQLYYCLVQAPSSLTSQTYSTSTLGAWIIKVVASAALITPALRKRRRKKVISKALELQKSQESQERLTEILREVLTELKETPSDTKKKATELQEESKERLLEILRCVLTELKETHLMSSEEILRLLTTKSVLLPVSIFKRDKNLGALEALCKYLKENLNLKFSEIAQLVGRDDRTVWTAYKSACKKNPDKFILEKEELFIPIEKLKGNLTILESIVLYLKEKEKLKNIEIAKLLKRDPRNVYSIYKIASAKNTTKKQ